MVLLNKGKELSEGGRKGPSEGRKEGQIYEGMVG